VAALRQAGHRLRLLAPSGPGSALVGPGPGELCAALPLDGPEMAELIGGRATGGPIEAALRAADLVLAWTRSSPLTAALRAGASRVLLHDPEPPLGAGHASSWLAAPLAELGVAAMLPPPPLRFTEAETRTADALSHALPPGFVAVHPGSGSRAKNWPSPRFVALAETLAAGQPWLLVAGPAEAEVGPAPQNAVVARELPLRPLAALLRRCGLYVGNDSGVSHLAAAAGAPTLAVFGPTDPATWAPVGPAVRTLRAPRGALDALSLASVLAAARELRAASAPTSPASGPPSG
jgi:heptosyltransferase-3